MSPTLHNGEVVIFEDSSNHELVIGDIVLANHPFKKDNIIVKRISKFNDSGDCFLKGDNPSLNKTTDSRSFGYIERKNIIAKLKDK